VRGNEISMIFQEPMSSLNPLHTVERQVGEVLKVHQGMREQAARARTLELLDRVGIRDPENRLKSYPHQLSGGQRQRVMIAMALANTPKLLIADEPTTALDVTVQAQILDLMLKLKEETGTAIQMITHDLGVIAEMADRIVVMYAGRVVEEASTVELFQSTLHPYTTGLLNSIPLLGSRTAGEHRHLDEIKGMVPSLYDLAEGCKFQERCTRAMDICSRQEPDLTTINPDHAVRCWLHIDH
jgi:oligopeptide/dipeptide ABC transporter ATP-binding protein